MKITNTNTLSTEGKTIAIVAYITIIRPINAINKKQKAVPILGEHDIKWFKNL